MQELAVFVIVGLAACYAVWKLMPRALRARAAYATAGWAQRRGSLSDHEAAALASRLTGSGCGECKSCGSCDPPSVSIADPSVSVVRFSRPAQANDRFDTGQ